MRDSISTRRTFLAGLTGLFCADADIGGPADVTLRIAPVQVEISAGRTIKTIGYNGTVPGPLIRFREGVDATVDLFNDTEAPEYVHWHGFDIPADLDGAEEERSLALPAHGHLRYRLTPRPSGSRYVHTHTMSMGDLNRSTFTGQFAFAYIEPKSSPGRFDQEIFLATHEWSPFLTSMEEEEDSSPSRLVHVHDAKETKPHDMEVAYRHFTINGKCLGHGDPIRVKEGQRVLFHFLNASATESVRLALPGHRFQVVALDGNPVPRPQLVDVVEMGTAERLDAIVEMNTPGVYVLGTPHDGHRKKGMGVVVEYANRRGAPIWVKPPESCWDYTIFGDRRPVPKPDAVIPLVIDQLKATQADFARWTLNGKTYDANATPTPLAMGKRYRLVFDNRSDDVHPVHLHRSSFELVSVDGEPTAGVIKDCVLVKGSQKIEADVTPQMEGLTLFHCHQQLHMDYGFKLLFNVV